MVIREHSIKTMKSRSGCDSISIGWLCLTTKRAYILDECMPQILPNISERNWATIGISFLVSTI